MSEKTAEELAAAANEQGTFSFIERLRGRNYAKDDVVIFLDEELGYKLRDLREELANAIGEQQKELEKQVAEVKEKLKESAYVLHMHGISNKDYDLLVDFTAEQFPYEYDEISNPLTGEKSRQIIPNDDRNEFFTIQLWKACIESVTDHTGATDSNIDDEFVVALREQAPLAAISLVAMTIDKLRMATQWIEGTTDEDFLAKP